MEVIREIPGVSIMDSVLARTFQVPREREREQEESRGKKDGTDAGVWDAAIMDEVLAMA